MATAEELRPQPGPQTTFLATKADIALYGGAAGGGKTYALLLEASRHLHVPLYSGVIFRRTSPQIRNAGGLWDESTAIFPKVAGGGTPKESVLEWHFKAGSKIKFNHLEHEKNKHDHQGAQYAFVGFDELTHFDQSQFWYMLSRNRSICGVRPYVRCSTNPDAESWVADFIDWWIDDDGYPIHERSGVVRYFVRDSGEVIWGDTPQDVYDQVPHLLSVPGVDPSALVKSFTFVPSKVTDNKILLKNDPGYMANLMSQSLVERERLLNGNWKIRPTAGRVFRREWFAIVDNVPHDADRIRYWDLAATEVKPGEDPDYTVGLKLACKDGRYWIEHIVRRRATPGEIEKLISHTAQVDGKDVPIRMEQEPGSSGVGIIDHYARNVLDGYDFSGHKTTGNKTKRANAVSAAAEMGNVSVVRNNYIEALLTELENFPDGRHDDQVDALSGAHTVLNEDDGSDFFLV